MKSHKTNLFIFFAKCIDIMFSFLFFSSFECTCSYVHRHIKACACAKVSASVSAYTSTSLKQLSKETCEAKRKKRSFGIQATHCHKIEHCVCFIFIYIFCCALADYFRMLVERSSCNFLVDISGLMYGWL